MSSNPYLALVAKLETAGGRKTIKGPAGEDSFNLFNIKQFNKGAPGFVAHDKAEGSRDRYRVYANTQESEADMVALLQRRYPEAYAAMQKPYGDDSVAEFAHGLKSRGYATDPDYVSKLVKLGRGIVPGKVTPVAAAVQAGALSPLKSVAAARVLRPDVALEEQKLREEARPSTLEQLGAAMAGATDARLFKGAKELLLGMPEEFPKDPEFVIPKEFTTGVDSDRLTERQEAGSKAELDFIMARQEDQDFRAKTVFDSGMTKGVLLSFAAEGASVSNWVAPWAAARTLGMQAARLAAQGKNSAAIGRSVTEALVAGTGLEVAAQVLEQRFDPANLALAGVADVAFGAGFGYAAVRAGVAQRAFTEAASREAALFEKAAANLGPGAKPEQIEAEYQNLRTQEIREPMAAGLAPTPTSSKLMESPDDMVDDVAGAADVPKVSSDLRAESRFAEPDNLANSDMTSVFDNSYAQARNMGLDLPDVEDTLVRSKAIDTLNAKPGTFLHGTAKESILYKETARAIESLRKQLIPDVTLHITDGAAEMGSQLGFHRLIGDRGSILGLSLKGGSPTAVHEFGHAVFAHRLAKATPEQQDAMKQAYWKWREAYATPGAEQQSTLQRSPISTVSSLPDSYLARAATGKAKGTMMDLWTEAFGGDVPKVQTFDKYFKNFDEFSAEQFGKFVESEVAGIGPGKLTVPQRIMAAIGNLLRSAAQLFGFAKDKGLVRADTAFEDWFVDLLNGNAAKGLKPLDQGVSAMAVPTVKVTTPAQSVNTFLTDPVAVKYGLTGLPVATPAERAKAKAILNLWKKADAFDQKYPLDEAWTKRADNLIDNSVFSAASTGLLMLKSKNPMARMIASELLEDASGVQGRRHSTAAISKYMHERLFMGNTINDVQNAYTVWRNKVGGSLKDDYFGGGEIRAKFDREIAQEIESRRVSGASLTTDPSVKAAADSLEKAYERIRKAQISNKTLGWAAMPGTSVGYMPHKISPSKWRQLTNEQRQVVHDALTEQFVNIEGWDIAFSDQLASRYLQRVQARAVGGHDAPIGGASAGSAEIVEDAMLSMGMSADEIRKNMQRFNRGAAGWTKGRLDLDLNRVYDVNGQPFKLLDVFDTDQLSLLRSQAGRASGEVALARKGVYGRPGMDLIRESMTYGENGARALDTELQAFDQVAAEFINAPFGTAGPKWMERARILNSVVRLGGIVFNQFAEFINAVTHVGVGRTLSAVGAMPRLRGEIKALASGKAVDNPLLTSIEKLGGAEFGTDSYKIIMPFDSPDMAYPTYGMDTVGVADRLLRGASYAQAKLSLWRTMHSVQQRGMAEQIVAKIARYSRDNTEDVALTQFGITPEMRRAIIADGAARWDGDSLVEFDVTKIKDPEMAEAIIQSVHRGVQQIIQGTFIGETGKWAHDGYLKVLTQFRTFSLTAMEKQWARQRNSRGTGAALGILLGSMSVAAPVYVARVYAQSVGRPDQEEYIERRLTPELIARQTLNYVALSGLAGDFLDIGAALAPDEYGVKMTGGRAGTDTDFVGNLVAPSMSLVDDVWKGFQNLDDPEKLARILPGSRIPYLLPAINALGD
jgi:hypothetical protein